MEVEVKAGDAVLIKDQSNVEDHVVIAGREIRQWDGNYDKRFYKVHLASGETVVCWPNAGIMNSADNSGRKWTPDQGVMISDMPDDEQPYRENSNELRRKRAASLLGLAAAAMTHVDPTLHVQLQEDLLPALPREPRVYANPRASTFTYPEPAQPSAPGLQARARRRALKKRR